MGFPGFTEKCQFTVLEEETVPDIVFTLWE